MYSFNVMLNLFEQILFYVQFAKPEVLQVQLLPSTVETMASMASTSISGDVMAQSASTSTSGDVVAQSASTSTYGDVMAQSASTSTFAEAMAPLASTSASANAVATSDDATPPSAKKYKPAAHGLFVSKN